MDPQVANALLALISSIKEVSPEMGDILDRAKRGEIDEVQAMQWLLESVRGDPSLSNKLQAMAMNNLAPLRDERAVGHFTDHFQGDLPAEVFVPRAGQGMPRMNPLYEAALIERAQFDGDMPELRTGDLPPGMLPAVPVKTAARNPIAIGAMVKKASLSMQRELTARTAERRRLAEAVAAGDPNALTIIQQHGALVAASGTDAIVQGTAASDPEGYRRGEVPKPMVVRRPRGSALALMSDAEKHEMAWRFLSTTQGRRSAVDTIRDLTAVFLSNKGLAVEEREFNPRIRETPLAYKEWSLMLSGPASTQPAFALVDVAAKSLANGLLKELGDKRPDMSYLEVEPINQVDTRTVGWMARLMPYT